jgi:hypothetical protein
LAQVYRYWQQMSKWPGGLWQKHIYPSHSLDLGMAPISKNLNLTRFKFPAALVQQWLGVTAGLLGS